MKPCSDKRWNPSTLTEDKQDVFLVDTNPQTTTFKDKGQKGKGGENR